MFVSNLPLVRQLPILLSFILLSAAGLAQTADWLMAVPPAETSEIESQLGDPFDYGFEDALITWWQEVTASRPQPRDGPYRYSHIYRHPARDGEGWRRA